MNPNTRDFIARQIGGTTQGLPNYNVTPLARPVPSTQYVAPRPVVAATAPVVQPTVQQTNTAMAGNQGYTAPVTANTTSPYLYKPTETDTVFNNAQTYYNNQANQVVPTEQDAYQSQLSRYQAEIDATNRVYNDILAKTRVESANRTGSAGARQARGGLLGSERGAAIDTQTSQFNASEEQSVENQRMASIAAIRGKARSDAAQEIKDKQAAKKAGYDDYIKFIGATEQRNQSKLSGLAAQLLASGIDINTMSQKEIEEVAKSYNVNKTDIISAYKTAKTADEANKLKTEQTKASIMKDQGQTLSEGQSYVQYNPSTGKFETVASGTPKGGTTYSGVYKEGENPTVDSWIKGIQNGTSKLTDIKSNPSLVNAVQIGLQSSGNDPAGKPTVTELGKKQLAAAKAAMLMFDNGQGTSIIGKSRLFGGGIITPGSDSFNLNNLIENIRSIASLDAVKFLKGQGAVSDAERALLQQSATLLNKSQSETEFKNTLQGIIDTLSGTPEGQVQSVTQSGGEVREKDGVKYQKVNGGWQPILTKVGGDTNQATLIANAIKQTESGGNYNAVGDAGTSAGAYQFQPSSWSSWSKQYTGQTNLPMTPENQDRVAVAKIQDLINQEYGPREIALIWNGGSPVEKKGFNKKIGLAYDSGAYADKVLKNLTA